jgi:hypothetical protein
MKMIIAIILAFGIGYLISRIKKEKKDQWNDGWDGQMGGQGFYGYPSGHSGYKTRSDSYKKGKKAISRLRSRN